MPYLGELLGRPDVALEEITGHLDGLAHPERVDQVMALNKRQQMKLWEVSDRSKPLTLDYLVPPDAKPLQYFPFEGKNSLLLDKRFQKIFYFDSGKNICGYNKQPLMWFTGPGYFMVRMNPRSPSYEIQIDYTRIPTEHPPGWPGIKSNDVFPTMFIYGGTKDNLRWVSKDVVIGRAYKMGEEPMPNWFVLCRAQPAPAE